NQVATLPDTLRMAAGIVVGRAADDRNEQRHFRQIELGQRLAEVELAGEPEPVDGAIAILAEKDLIDVGVHEIGLAEVRIERDRHDRLARLAPQRLPRIEKIASDQLLCQGAAALLDLACAHVDPQRARNRGGIDTVMSIELAALAGLEGLGQPRWTLRR